MSRYNNYNNENWMNEGKGTPPPAAAPASSVNEQHSHPSTSPSTFSLSSFPFQRGRFTVFSSTNGSPPPIPVQPIPTISYFMNKPRGLRRKNNMNRGLGIVPRIEFYEYDIQNYTYNNSARFGDFKKRESTNQNKNGIVSHVNHPTSDSLYHYTESSIDPLVSTHEHIKNIPNRTNQLEIMNYYKKYKNWQTRLPNANIHTIRPFYTLKRKEHIMDTVRRAYEIQLAYVQQFIPDILTKRKHCGLNEGSFIYQVKLEPGEKLIIFGDFHGSLHTFIRHLFRLYLLGVINLDNYYITEGYRIVFLGDVVDRGNYGLDIIYLISKIMMVNNNNEKLKCILNRGNHEERELIKHYGFIQEMNRKNIHETTQNLIIGLFELCSSAVVFHCNSSKYWCCHGGIPIEFKLSKKIFKIPTLEEGDVNRNYVFYIDNLDISLQIRWNDFTSKADIQNSSRGPGIFEIGTIYLENFMKVNSIDFILRGHQDSMYNSTILCSSLNINENIRKSYSKIKLGRLNLSDSWYNLSKVPINSSLPIPEDDNILFEKNINVNRFFHKIPFDAILPNYRVNGAVARIDTYSGTFKNLNGLVKNINSGEYEFYPVVTISTNTDNGRPFTKDSFALLRLDGDDGTSLFTKEYIMASEYLLETILGPDFVDSAGGKKKKKSKTKTKKVKKTKKTDSKK